VYCFKNFYVVANWHTYKTSMHEFMLQFNHETIMKHTRSDNFPYHMYRPIPFHTLKGNPSVDAKQLIGKPLFLYILSFFFFCILLLTAAYIFLVFLSAEIFFFQILLDLIGRIVEIRCPQEKTINGHNTVLIDFVLEDAM